jgi:class 3 adenylate cyclase
MARVGDKAWNEWLERHHTMVRRELVSFRGRDIDVAGDGFFATFDGPARGVHCALRIQESARRIGLDIRAGLHTGEVELHDDKVVGIAVHIGARVAGIANGGETMVSSTVKDLVSGSGLRFEDRGTHALKGVPGEWRLFAASG